MKDPNDVRGTKAARNILSKKGIDISLADVRVIKGHCEIRGVLGVMAGHEIEDLETEVEGLIKVLRSKPEIRDVKVEVTYRNRTS
jgi:hypothetical protein